MMLTDTVKQISDGQQKMVQVTHHLASGVSSVPDTITAPAADVNATAVTWAQRASSTAVPVRPIPMVDDQGF